MHIQRYLQYGYVYVVHVSVYAYDLYDCTCMDACMHGWVDGWMDVCVCMCVCVRVCNVM